MVNSAPDKASDPSSKSDQPNISLSPAEAKFLYWFTGLIQILKALTPITTYIGTKKSPHLPKAEQAQKLYHDVVTDVGRQTMTCTFQLVSYFIAGDLIKAGLNQFFSKKVGDLSPEEKSKHDAQQQVIVTVVSLGIQVAATIMSRMSGAAHIIKFLDREKMPTPTQGGKWHQRLDQWVDKHLRDSKTLHLRPGKTSLVATFGMAVYLSSLAGVLWGISSLLEKAFPQVSSKPKAKQGDVSQQNPTTSAQPFSQQSAKPPMPANIPNIPATATWTTPPAGRPPSPRPYGNPYPASNNNRTGTVATFL